MNILSLCSLFNATLNLLSRRYGSKIIVNNKLKNRQGDFAPQLNFFLHNHEPTFCCLGADYHSIESEELYKLKLYELHCSYSPCCQL